MNRKVPGIYTGISLFLAFAASLILSGWFRQLTILYGSQMKSTVTIISEVFICLSLGAWLFGHLADKVKKPLSLCMVLLALSTIYIFFQKPVFRVVQDLTNPENSVIFILAPLIMMVIPLSLISGTLPLLGRYFIRNISHAGIFMSITLFSISAGITVAILLAVFLLIPYFGIRSLFITGGISLSVALALTVWCILRHNDKNQSSSHSIKAAYSNTPIRFRKKRIVLEAGAKLTRAMLYGSVFQAFSFSSLLIIYLRILIKYNHLNPVHFYSAVLFVVFVGVAGGSALYGIIADKPANKYLTLAILQIITGISSLLSFAILQILVPDIYSSFHNSSSFTELNLQHIILISLLVFIPSVLHGLSLPLAGRLYPKRLQHIGKTFGKLNSLILLSLLAGIIFTPLILIPLIGIHPSYLFMSMLIVLSGVYLIIRDSRLIRGLRLAFAFGALLVFILILAVLRMLNISQRNRASDGIYEGSTASVRFMVNADSTKSVYINDDYYFGTDRESLKEQFLSACIPLMIQPEIKSVMVIGFNTGITSSVFDNLGIQDILITEKSPELIRLSSGVFSDENADILTESVVRIRVTDPRAQLTKSDKSFDLIISGSEQYLLFPGRYTREFFKICYGKLSDNGLYCQSLPYSKLDSITVSTIYRSCSEVFNYVSMWYIAPGRILIIGAKRNLIPDYCRLSDTFEEEKFSGFKNLGIKDIDSFLAHYIFTGDPFTQQDLPDNSDLFPELEFRYARKEMDEDILHYFTKYAEPENSFAVSDSCTIDKAGVRTRINKISQSLWHDVSSSYVVQPHTADSSALKGSPSQQYP